MNKLITNEKGFLNRRPFLLVNNSMKNSLIVLAVFILVLSPETNAQFTTEKIISLDTDGAKSIFSADLDGDGFMDVISASGFDDKIAWYKNLNAQGGFSKQIIIGLLDQTNAVHAADLDGDGDIDVIGVTFANDLVVWYENKDGLGNFGPQRVISDTGDAAFSAIAADLDGDGDMDVISGSVNDDTLAWYENLDGLGTFSSENIISIAGNARSLSAADIDNDGDIDLLETSSGDIIVGWYENLDGAGTFGTQNPIGIPPEPFSTISVFGVDIDGDGDIDVLTGAAGENNIAWYENLDGAGNFSDMKLISGVEFSVLSVYAADLDNDGDNDVIAAAFNDGFITFYENLDGLGTFGPQQIINDSAIGANSVFTADLDNDGDIDILSASQNDDTVSWYENQTILSVPDTALTTIVLHPNPSKNSVTISGVVPTLITHINLYDVKGNLLYTQKENTTQLDVSTFAKGIYFLELHTATGSVTKKLIKE